MAQSRVLVLCLSRNALGPEWPELESATLRFRDPSDQARRFVPLRLDDIRLPDGLQSFAWVDWRMEDERAYGLLLEACRPPADVDAPLSPSIPVRVISLAGAGLVYSVAMSRDGRRAVCGSDDGTLRLWDTGAPERATTLSGHSGPVWGLALSEEGGRAISGSSDGTVRVWDVDTRACTAALGGHTHGVNSVALSGDGHRAISGSSDGTVRLWDLQSHVCLAVLEAHTRGVNSVALSADGRRAVSGSPDGTVRLWDLESHACAATLEGHSAGVWGVALTRDARQAVSGSQDRTMRLWDTERCACIAAFEGHTAWVNSVALSDDGRRALSGSEDGTMRVWDLATHDCVAILKGHRENVCGVGLSGDGRQAVSGADDRTVRLWELGALADAGWQTPAGEQARYTNAKALLVGPSGAGKTALSIRLAEDRWEPATSSTDGVAVTRSEWASRVPLAQVHAAPGMDREVWLWDFAGQHDYRLVHQLFMDEAAMAVLVFNPQDDDVFEHLGEWDRALQRAARRPFCKLLVAGRTDRGGLTVSAEGIERFREARGFARYIETSSLTGAGCDELRQAIAHCIPWDQIEVTVSPVLFRQLKEEIVKLRDEGKVLLRMGELKQQLELRLPQSPFTIEELRTVVRLLAGPGVVWQLEFGDFVLLQPERVNAYAAAVVRSVRAHREDIGCILEDDVLAGRLDFQDVERLPEDEEWVVLRAMHQTFVDHGLCLRERTEQGTVLVFPSYFRRERPTLEGHPNVLVTYRFTGPLDEIYATLVVCLLHTQAFEKDQLWRYAADFRTPAGRRLGLKVTGRSEGEAQMDVYLEPDVPEDTQVSFIRYIHDHLLRKAQDVVRVRHYICQSCGEPLSSRAVQARLERGHTDIGCPVCEKERITLLDLVEEKFASEDSKRRARELQELAAAGIDNESRELVLVANAYSIVAEAGQIYRQYTNSDHGIDGEIEFKDWEGKASGQRLYVQLKSGDSYLYERKRDGAEIFTVKNPRHADYWQRQAYPVMLVIRTSDGEIRWMDISAYLKRETEAGREVKQVVFEGEPFTALSVRRMRDRYVPRA